MKSNIKTKIMKENKVYYGTLEKSEVLLPIDIPEGLGTLVYKSHSPFFGYYDDYPGKHNDNIYYYLVLERRMTFAQMHRAILQAYQQIDVEVDMDHATLLINHTTYSAVRLRYLENIEDVAKIQKIFTDLGFEFYGGKAKGETPCFTKIIKYFDLDDLGNGIWIDRVADSHAYLQLPSRLELEDFKDLVKRVRNNWDGNTFDAGLAVFSTKDEVIEVVRIYSKSIHDEAYLEKLKQVFEAMM